MNNKVVQKPMVSICCDAYNHAPYIAQAIEGFLLQQVDFPVEILIHDDASTDGTADIIRRYQVAHPRLIKPIYQTQNQHSRGIKVGRFNFERAQGTYIALCQGDDYWTDPLKLRKQVGFLEENKSYVLCFTDFNNVNERGEIMRQSAVKEEIKTDLGQSEILGGLTPKYMTIMFRRSALDLPLLSGPRLRNGDIFLSAIVTRHGAAKYLDFISGCYRAHAGGIWSTRNAIERRMMLLKSLAAMRKALKRDSEVKALKKRMGDVALRLGRLSAARDSWAGLKTILTDFYLMPYTWHFVNGVQLQNRGPRQKKARMKARAAKIRKKNFRKKIKAFKRGIRSVLPDYVLDMIRMLRRAYHAFRNS